MKEDKVKAKLEEMMNGGLDPVVTFAKPFKFEDKEYTKIDLSAVGELSGARLAQLEKLFYKTGNQAPVVELSMAYAMFVAMSSTDQPLEFFEQLPAKEATKVKFVVMDFLM
jgi:hypothetical protein